jgi:hypothetical protein
MLVAAMNREVALLFCRVRLNGQKPKDRAYPSEIETVGDADEITSSAVVRRTLHDEKNLDFESPDQAFW